MITREETVEINDYIKNSKAFGITINDIRIV